MKLGDICSKIGSGATPRGGKDSYKDYGIPIIRSQNVRDWAFSSSGLAFIDDEQARVLSSAVVEQGDVLLNITGDSVARACKAPAEFESARVNQHVAIIRANENANNSFLLAWLQASKSLLLKLASSGATRNALTKGMLENLDVNLPPIDVQNKIAVLVDSIQAKIAANTKLNGYLEELALALYTEHLEWSDGELPVGWVRRPLSDFFPVKTGKKDANIATENGIYPFFTCGKQNLFTDNYSFDGSAILVAGNGDFSVKWYEGKFEAYQRTYVLMPNDPALLGYLYCAVKRNLSNITSKSRGSVIKFITKGNIADYEIAVPPIPEMNEIIKHLNQILRVIDANKRDTALLKELRDVLLPKLMSGEIDVSKIDLKQLNSHFGDCSLESSFQKPKER